MMKFDRFTEIAQESLQRSAEIIQRYGHNQIDTEHVMLAILEQNSEVISKILEKLKVNKDQLIERFDATLRASPKAKIIGNGTGQIYITPRVKRIIDLSNVEANRMKDLYITNEHLFLSILTESNTPVARILESGGVKRDKVLAIIEDLRGKKQPIKKLPISGAPSAVEDLQPKKQSTEKSLSKKVSTKTNNNVFIVHGHDDAMKEAVARTIEKIGLNAIVLHEKPNQGKTIIEKFTNYSDVGFAIVLLSPDDISSSKNDASDKKSFRARQNVIFELGFFIGKLGRDRVIALYRQVDGFELPSDYSGVLYIPFDDYHHWRFDIIRELKASGYKLDANKLLE